MFAPRFIATLVLAISLSHTLAAPMQESGSNEPTLAQQSNVTNSTTPELPIDLTNQTLPEADSNNQEHDSASTPSSNPSIAAEPLANPEGASGAGNWGGAPEPFVPLDAGLQTNSFMPMPPDGSMENSDSTHNSPSHSLDESKPFPPAVPIPSPHDDDKGFSGTQGPNPRINLIPSSKFRIILAGDSDDASPVRVIEGESPDLADSHRPQRGSLGRFKALLGDSDDTAPDRQDTSGPTLSVNGHPTTPGALRRLLRTLLRTPGVRISSPSNDDPEGTISRLRPSAPSLGRFRTLLQEPIRNPDDGDKLTEGRYSSHSGDQWNNGEDDKEDDENEKHQDHRHDTDTEPSRDEHREAVHKLVDALLDDKARREGEAKA